MRPSVDWLTFGARPQGSVKECVIRFTSWFLSDHQGGCMPLAINWATLHFQWNWLQSYNSLLVTKIRWHCSKHLSGFLHLPIFGWTRVGWRQLLPMKHCPELQKNGKPISDTTKGLSSSFLYSICQIQEKCLKKRLIDAGSNNFCMWVKTPNSLRWRLISQ